LTRAVPNQACSALRALACDACRVLVSRGALAELTFLARFNLTNKQEPKLGFPAVAWGRGATAGGERIPADKRTDRIENPS